MAEETEELLERAKTLRAKGANKEQWEFATLLGEVCDRLEQQRECIECIRELDKACKYALENWRYSPLPKEFIPKLKAARAKAEELIK